MYGIIAQQLDVGEPFTIVELFIAGIGPLMLMLGLLIAFAWWSQRGKAIPRVAFSWQRLRTAIWDARWELPLPFVVLGGIYSGLFAVSEAAAVTAAYVLLLNHGLVSGNQYSAVAADYP